MFELAWTRFLLCSVSRDSPLNMPPGLTSVSCADAAEGSPSAKIISNDVATAVADSGTGITGPPISRRLVKGAQSFFWRRQPPSECFLLFHQRQVSNRARFFTLGCEHVSDRARHP
jgi:hypothetical protein